MISLLYRTHKGLPTPNKISSLYVFDSIARAAHRTKTKKGLVADLNSSGGNAASFLVRLEGMLDGVVEDMLANGPPEAKVSPSLELTSASIHHTGLALPFAIYTCHCFCLSQTIQFRNERAFYVPVLAP